MMTGQSLDTVLTLSGKLYSQIFRQNRGHLPAVLLSSDDKGEAGWEPSRVGLVDKSKNSAETYSGPGRTENLEIEKDGMLCWMPFIWNFR